MSASKSDGTIRAGIVGGTGYAGAELLRLLAQHPAVELLAITSRGEAGTRVDRLFTSLRGRVGLVTALALAPGSVRNRKRESLECSRPCAHWWTGH